MLTTKLVGTRGSKSPILPAVPPAKPHPKRGKNTQHGCAQIRFKRTRAPGCSLWKNPGQIRLVCPVLSQKHTSLPQGARSPLSHRRKGTSTQTHTGTHKRVAKSANVNKPGCQEVKMQVLFCSCALDCWNLIMSPTEGSLILLLFLTATQAGCTNLVLS